MKSTIILIGPLGAGKTTVGQLLASKLLLPYCSVDQVRPAYYTRVEYDDKKAAQLATSETGIWSVLQYSKPFEIKMIEIILKDHAGVIDFGASNSVYDDVEQLTQVEAILAPYPNIFLLLPYPDPDESIQILKERLIRMLTQTGKTYRDELFHLNEYFVKHPSNRRLAKMVIYTKDKTPEAICAELIQKLK